MGRCGLIRVDWKNRVGEIGIMIGAPYRGRGYGPTEAMEAALPLRLSGDESPQAEGERFRLQQGGNPLLQKSGFIQEGLLKSEIFRAGAYQDVVELAKFSE